MFSAKCCLDGHDMCDPCCVCGEPEGLNDTADWVVVNPLPARDKKRRKIENPWPQEKR